MQNFRTIQLRTLKMKRFLFIVIFAFLSGCEPSEDFTVVVDDAKCLGYTCRICEKVCRFDAIHFYGPDSTPVIDPNKCTSCGNCVKECPQQALTGKE